MKNYLFLFMASCLMIIFANYLAAPALIKPTVIIAFFIALFAVYLAFRKWTKSK